MYRYGFRTLIPKLYFALPEKPPKFLKSPNKVVSFHSQKMGGVDRADQSFGQYDHDGKSNKYWKKYVCNHGLSPPI